MKTINLSSIGRFAALAACLWITAACGSNTRFVQAEDDSPTADTQSLSAISGLAIYSQEGCNACHCNNGEGMCSLGAPDLRNGPRAEQRLAPLDLSEIRRRLDTTLVSAQGEPIKDPALPPKDHPIKIEYSPEEFENLAMFLERLDPTVAAPTGEASQISKGFTTYLQAGCVMCHLFSAQGSNQGGMGVPIAGTEPDNIFNVLTDPANSTHPVRATGATVCPTCESTVMRNAVADSLVDTPPPDLDPERQFLSSFLTFIQPPVQAGVDPCLGRAGEICTIAGQGVGGFTKDDVASTTTRIYYPIDVTGTLWDPSNPDNAGDDQMDLVIDDWNNHRVRVVEIDQMTLANPADPTTATPNMIFSIAGTGKVTGDDALNHPTDAEFDRDGSLVMANWHNQNIYRYPAGLASGGDRHQLAGLCDLVCQADNNGPTQVATLDADGNFNSTFIALPSSIAPHPDGRIFVAEAGCSRIRILTPGSGPPAMKTFPPACTGPVNLWNDGTIETLAGKVMTPVPPMGAPPPAAQCGEPGGRCVAMNGYVDNGLARDAVFRVNNGPVVYNFGISLDKSGPNGTPRYLYIADSDNNVIRRIDITLADPTIELFAGNPGDPAAMPPVSGAGFMDEVPALQARFRRPANVHVGFSGTIYVADTGNHRIRAITPDGSMVTTIAGSGTATFNGDNQIATGAALNQPNGVWEHPDGRVFIADTLNNRIRVVCPANGPGCTPSPDAEVELMQ